MAEEDKIYFVPWADSSEWNTVKDQIFSSNIKDTIRAYETILMWKLKHDAVPAYVECTYSLLQVMIKEYEMTENENPKSLFSEQDLQLSYSTALIRFVNLVTSIKPNKGETLYWAAKTRNIPDWIISLRHDAAHGQDLPTLDALHVAAELSLKWLLNNYWSNNESFAEKELNASLSNCNMTVEENINAGNFLKNALAVWVLCAGAEKANSMNDMEKEFFLYLDETLILYNDYFNDISTAATDLENLIREWRESEENGSVNWLINFGITQFRKIFLLFIKEVITSKEELKYCFLLTLMETSFYSDKPTVKIWKRIIHIIQEVGLFSSLLQLLFQQAGKGHKAASAWLLILQPSIKQLNKEWSLYRTLKRENKTVPIKQLKFKVKKSLRHKHDHTVLDLSIFKPPIITLDMMKGVLLNPESFSTEGIFSYLKLIKQPLQKSAVDMIRDLIELQTVNNINSKKDIESDKIFTVDDLQDVLMKDSDLMYEEAVDVGNGWVKSNIDVQVWSKTPLGLLPFQTKVDCSLPSDLRWVRRAPTKKTSIPLMNHSEDMKKNETN